MPRNLYSSPPATKAFVETIIGIFNSDNNISQIPQITSGIGDIDIERNEPYVGILTSISGVEYEWFGLPPGLVVSNRSRRIIEGTPTTDGAYPVSLLIENERGQQVVDIFTITVTPPFNQFSVQFNNNDYTDATADTSNPLYAAGPSGTPWTISAWFKAGTSNNNEQTILSFGGASQANDGRVQLWMHGGQDRLTFRYGTNGRFVEKQTANGTIIDGEWNHILITYDGGITGGNIGDNPDSVYLDAFSVYLNDVLQVTTDNVGSGGGLEGWPNGIVDDFFRFGRNCDAGNYLQNNSLVDEIALWTLDAETVVGLSTEIYGSGKGHDLSLISNPPPHWWRMGDGDTFPTLQDTGSVGTYDMTMTNQVASDIVLDAPGQP